MSSFSNSVFHGGTIRLDNVKYVGCSFNGCVVEYGGEGPIWLEGCSFDKCNWTLVGSALNTLQFLKTMQQEFGEFGAAMISTIFAGIISPASPAESVALPNREELPRQLH